MLSSLLSITDGDIISIVGSGGKTTLMYRLAHELVDQGKLVITTTTTRLLPPSSSESRVILTSPDASVLVKKVTDLLPKERQVTLAREVTGGKLVGLSPDVIDELRIQKIADIMVIEADGARHCPVKAPNETEPVIPSCTTHVVAVIGLEGLGKPNADPHVFRPDYFARLSGIKEGDSVTPEALASVVLHPEGLLRGTPRHARVTVILNQADTEERKRTGETIVGHIMGEQQSRVSTAVITTLQPTVQVLEWYGRLNR